MTLWKTLELSGRAQQIPQLFIKSDFDEGSYAVYVTDLSRMWGEELHLDGIIGRALEEESPIEISKHDDTQLPVLLEHLSKPLRNDVTTTCLLAPDDDNLILQTTSVLPEPLDALTWTFRLSRKSSDSFRTELLLPLLTSSFIQSQQVNTLVACIHEKDKIIARLLDQFESSGIDLGTVFPSVGSIKASRKAVRREQAVQHIQGLKPFDETTWRKSSSKVPIRTVTMPELLGAIVGEGCSAAVEGITKQDGDYAWWRDFEASLLKKSNADVYATSTKAQEQVSGNINHAKATSDDEFQTQATPPRLREAKSSEPVSSQRSQVLSGSASQEDSDHDETTEDEDLDAPIKRKVFSKSRARSADKISTEDAHPPVASSPSSTIKPRSKFVIGGTKARGSSENKSEATCNDASSTALESSRANPNLGQKSVKKPFSIGGQQRGLGRSMENKPYTSIVPDLEKQATETGPNGAAGLRETAAPREIATDPVSTRHVEETAEDKAERRRQELKRKNEELARKQAQKRQKKKF